MPIYEEKLISPLAVRFTQQRIRETFRDGYEVEKTISEMKTRPGIGVYDLVIEAPFPNIEIIRYAPHGRSADNEGEDDHWFSFDNRRLYCLQRLAAEHWPKHVGAVVEVLYADNGAIRKKLDSLTCGMSVSIGHAFATADELASWDWHEAVRFLAPPGLKLALDAEDLVDADDAKASISDLTNAPGQLSAFERLSMAFASVEPLVPAVPAAICRTTTEDSSAPATASTAATDTASQSNSDDLDSQPKDSDKLQHSQSEFDVSECLLGVWTGDKGETYTVSWKGETFQCVREDGYHAKRFTLELDSDSDCVWWGIQGAYYASISELGDKDDQLKWYKATDQPGRRPRFMWHKTATACKADESTADANRASGQTQKGSSRQAKWHSKHQQNWQQPCGPAKSGHGKWVTVANSGGA